MLPVFTTTSTSASRSPFTIDVTVPEICNGGAYLASTLAPTKPSTIAPTPAFSAFSMSSGPGIEA
jgi:hypothetical protein